MNCQSCCKPLGNLLYFCRDCFMLLPGKERVELYVMHGKKLNTDSKVAKCVRILKDKQTKAEHIAK